MKQLKYISVIALLGLTQVSFAQKKDDNIGTEVVNVVKPYTPSISDAFKIKETPTLDDEETSKKENIQYNIFSFPVASTFAPAKGRAASVDKSAEEKIYSNYMTLGAGNYGTVNAELFVTENVSNTDYFGGMLRHNSTQGGIDEIVLDDKMFNTSLDLTYGSRAKGLSWNADLGYQHQIYNWYGLHPGIFDDATIENIDERQTYHTLYLGGRLGLDNVLKESSLRFTRFWDAFGSAENRFVAKPSLEFDIVEQKIKADFVLDYISGSFDQTYNGGGSYKYGFTNFGFQPSIKINKGDLSMNAGVGFFYSAAQEGGESKFFIYPQVTGSFKVVGDLMVFYAGIEGTLQQNSYHDFVQENFFVSPTLGVAPTDQKYDVFAGLKGKLASSVSYNIRGSYKAEEGKALFKSNGYDDSNANTEGYTYGNSFNVVYDKVKTISFFGELKADFSKNVSFGINGTFSSFSTDVEKEAWNLPSIKLATTLDVTITPKWYAGSSLFFVGERKDQFITSSLITPFPIEEVTLKSYFDLNLHVGYKFSERMTFFLKGNNLANQDYQKWLNYPVQGIQVLGGASYKFDF
ncbi:TonB-dependent receptor [Flavobacterium wongokense]|uniref:TonB-dependent receptor n=1 Tax=Flavobacterium wongokense TaxID=2910674 RepID=UPI001F354267|nr:TonB-dependent receptor [Flavobacterium sp. WG47]MCF6130685.1 TonB-dependent receptor [Flavobacterium sp. WG47]